MKRTYLVVIISAFLIALLAFSYSYVQSQKASANLAQAFSELKNIEFTSALQNIPDNNVERNLSQARIELDRAASQVRRIKDTIAKISSPRISVAGKVGGISVAGKGGGISVAGKGGGISVAGKGGGISVAGKSEAIGSIEQATSKLAEVEAESRRMIDANAEFMVTLTTLQGQHEAKIASLEERIAAIKNSKFSIGLEFFLGLMGLITAVSTLLLAWRKDSREVDALRIEIAKVHASSPNKANQQ